MTADIPSGVDRLTADLYQLVHQLPTAPNPDDDLETRFHQWNAMNETLNLLKDRERVWALDIGDHLHADGLSEGDITSVDGVPVRYTRSRSYRWNGELVLDELTVAVVEAGTGEVHHVVPRAVLDRVLPAVTGGATSSRWNTSGMSKALVRRARTVTMGEPVAKPGAST